MTLLTLNLLLMLLGPVLIVAGVTGLAVAAGFPRRPSAHVYWRSAPRARTAVV
jgi:hypothetical protein